jgi:DNA-binding response OmpR family regulator
MSRILIVEDDPDLAELMQFTLRAAGYQLSLAVDGASALHQLRSSPPDLAIIDIMLPDIVGLNLCEIIRADATPGANTIPIIISSACGPIETRPLALSAGANEFLPKPFSPHQLRELVQRLLRANADRIPATVS